MSGMIISWFADVGTLACIWLSGRKNIVAWPVGLVAQALWLVFSFKVGDPGLIFLNVAVTVVYGHNWWLWRKRNDHQEEVSRR